MVFFRSFLSFFPITLFLPFLTKKTFNKSPFSFPRELIASLFDKILQLKPIETRTIFSMTLLTGVEWKSSGTASSNGVGSSASLLVSSKLTPSGPDRDDAAHAATKVIVVRAP